MIWIDIRGGIYLQAIVVLPCIFKQAIHWVQHLMWQKKEPFSEMKRKFWVKNHASDHDNKSEDSGRKLKIYTPQLAIIT